MGQEDKYAERDSKDKQGGTIDPQPGGQGVEQARESPGPANAGREPLEPGPIPKGDTWRPTDDPVGERRDGEDSKTGAGLLR